MEVRCIRCRRTLAEGASARWYWCAGPAGVEPLPPDRRRWVGGGRHRLRGLLGRGGVGEVYLADDTSTGRTVAVKLLTGTATRNERTQQRFRREIQVALELDDPGVVGVVDGEVRPGHTAWIAMEWVRGPSLRAVLADGPLPLEETVRIGAVLARTLARLHARGLAHRDVKPSNVLLRPEGVPLLTDFGLVAMLAGEERVRLTTQAVGTPAYMAPEQLLDPRGSHDPCLVDQFALGLAIEECITGRLLDQRALEGSLVSEAHPELGRVLARAHHPDPMQRYASIDDLAEDLERVHDGRPVLLRRPGLHRRLARGLVRRRALWSGAAGALLVAGLALGGGRLATEAWAERAAQLRLDSMERRTAVLREEGREAEAEAVFEAYVTLPENQGRDALALAWLGSGQRALDLPTFDRSLDHLARAFVAGTRPTTRGEVAAVLDVALRQAGRYAAAHALRRAFPGAVEPADDVRLMLEAGDLEGLEDRLPSDDRRLVLMRRLQPSTELPARVRHTGDLDGDGDEDMFLEAPHPLGLPLEGLPVREVADDLLKPVFDSPYWVRATRDGGLLERVGDGRMRVRCSFDGRGRTPALFHDGGVWLLTGGTARTIRRLDPVTCEESAPFPQLEELGSFPLDLDFGDLDGDGVDEAVVAVGPPRGHGVWVLAQSLEGWAIRAEHRLGYVADVRILETAHGPRIVATATHFHPNPVLFPDPPHLGVPAGLYVLAWERDGLRRVDALLSRPLLDTRERHWVSTWSGQLDADGLEDLVTSDGYVYLSTDRPDQPFERVPTGFSSLDFVVDVDHDGLAEVGATVEQQTLLLGLGAPRSPRASDDVPPDTGEPALDGARALERIGLAEQAAEAYARIGRGRTDTTATDALVRAAQLFGPDRPDEAAAAAEEAAARGRLDQVGPAVLSHLEALAVEQAARVVARHAAAEGSERLRSLVDTFSRRVGLPVLIQRGVSDGLVRPETGGLRVEAVDGAGTLFAVPLRQTGEVVGLHATLSALAMDFASVVEVRLSNGAGQPLVFRMEQRERGGVHHRYLGEVGWGAELQLEHPGRPTRFDVWIQELPDTAWVVVQLMADGELLQRKRVPRNRGEGDDWLLEVVAPGVAVPGVQTAEVLLERLDVLGLDAAESVAVAPIQVEPSLDQPAGRARLQGRLRRDPTYFADLQARYGREEALALAAETFATLPDTAVGLLPELAGLDPVELAAASPGLAVVRAAMLCEVGREESGRAGLEALSPEERCRALEAHRRCRLPPGDCSAPL